MDEQRSPRSCWLWGSVLGGGGGEVGTVEPGKEADLLVVEGSPDQRITDVTRVLAVFKAGRRVR